MEELQSIKVLDQEILEDARKQAYRILKTAEESVKTSADYWEKKGDADIIEVQQKYAERTLKLQGELKARFILDKRRIRSEKIEALLKSALETYLLNLNRETLLSILERRLQKQLKELRKTGDIPSEDMKIQSHQLKDAELEQILNNNLPQGSWIITDMPPLHNEPFPAIIVNAPAMRIVASVRAMAKDLLEDKRAELVAALLGEEVLLEGDAV